MFVLCVLYSKDKRQKPGQRGRRTTDKVERENKRKNPAPFYTGAGAHQPPIKWVPGIFPGGKAAGVLTTHPHIESRLKKEWSYTFTPHLGLHGLF
jgi:hypothetical protein